MFVCWNAYADPGVFEGFSSCDAFGRIDSQHLINQIFSFRGHCVPLRRRKLHREIRQHNNVSFNHFVILGSPRNWGWHQFIISYPLNLSLHCHWNIWLSLKTRIIIFGKFSTHSRSPFCCRRIRACVVGAEVSYCQVLCYNCSIKDISLVISLPAGPCALV